MAGRGLQALDRIVCRLHALDLVAGARASTSDAAWAPTVPAGHTSYSWTGTTAPRPATIESEGEVSTSSSAAAASAGSAAPAPDAAADASEGAVPAALLAQFAQLEFRVGKIVSVKRHPDADSLYVEQIDIGENSAREIVSGLVKYIPEEGMLGARVLVFANLKPSKLRGITSNGMVLCAANADRTAIEFVSPPPSAVPGDLVVLEGAKSPAAAAFAGVEINPKKKANAWTECAPFLKTDDDGVARFHGLALAAGPDAAPCRSQTIRRAQIS